MSSADATTTGVSTSPASQPTPGRKGFRLSRLFKSSETGAFAALVVLCLVFASLAPGFRSVDNLIVVTRQVSLLAIIGVGLTLVIITAGIDLSVGSLAALSGVTVAFFVAQMGLAAIPAILLTLVALGVLGLLVGLSVSVLGLQPFIVTLAVFAAAKGMAAVITGGTVIIYESDFLITLGTGYLGPVPIPVVIAAVVLVIGQIALTRTRYGRYVYAVGGNQEAARVSGVPVRAIKASVYVISAMTAGLAGIILAGRLHAGDPFAGQGLELDVIAAVVIGGTSLFGGVGNMRGTLIGVLIIGVISNGLTILNVQSFWQDVVKGAVIFIAMVIDAYFRRRGTT